MDTPSNLVNLRTQLCIVFDGFNPLSSRKNFWTQAAMDFLNHIYKKSIHTIIIGPKPASKLGTKLTQKFGFKKTIQFLDHNEVISLKSLEASRSHHIELKALNTSTRSWTRLRTQACLVIGKSGVWPKFFPGWTLPGTLSIDTFLSWFYQYKLIPGKDVAFLGSSNQVLRCALNLFNHNVQSCYILSPSSLQCWNSYKNSFISKGGRIFSNCEIIKLEKHNNFQNLLYLKTTEGTLILPIDTLVSSYQNTENINQPHFWKNGFFYLHIKRFLNEPFLDEEVWLEDLDWEELSWRLNHYFDTAKHSIIEGNLKLIKQKRKQFLAYRKPERKKELLYNGKILNQETLQWIQQAPSVPKTFEKKNPVASLECFENIPCRACADICPESAIEIPNLTDLPQLLENKCTGCGACVAICPASAAVMVQEFANQQKAKYFFADDTKELWQPKKPISLLNRQGQILGMGRIQNSLSYKGGLHRILEIEATNVYTWDARSFQKYENETSEIHLEQNMYLTKKCWILLNGVKRLSPEGIPLSIALWQLGQKRFEDALFCADGSCRLCNVNIDGKAALACQTLVKAGQSIQYNTVIKNKLKNNLNSIELCPCKNISTLNYEELLKEGVPDSLIKEVCGLGYGTCHGRWCIHSQEIAAQKQKSLQNYRPLCTGYEISLWREVWAEEIQDES